MTGWPTYRGRALDCHRCASGAPSAACSCIRGCGADGCTGEPQPVIDKPTRHVVRNRKDEEPTT